MSTPTCASEAARRRIVNRQRRRAREKRLRQLKLAAIVILFIGFAVGYISGCGAERARNRQTPASTTVFTPAAQVDETPSPTAPPVVKTLDDITVVQPTEVAPAPLYRDDIVSDGRLLSYELQEIMMDCCEEYGVPYALALAIAEVETHFDPDAVSGTGDYGLMQINEINHEALLEIGIDPLTYEGNIHAGVYIIAGHLDRYGDPELALMAYNCGPTGARRLWDQGIYETEYSRKVMTAYEYWLSVLEA